VTDAFRAMIVRAARALGSQTALAAALGVHPARISRLRRGAGDYQRLNVENCLRLSAILGVPPADVLHAAGHADLAALLETLWNEPRERQAMAVNERRLLRLWRDQSPERQAAVLSLLDTEGGSAVASSRRPRFPVAARNARGRR
jgi:transcriptional regulator with XRE-family HTH domain